MMPVIASLLIIALTSSPALADQAGPDAPAQPAAPPAAPVAPVAPTPPVPPVAPAAPRVWTPAPVFDLDVDVSALVESAFAKAEAHAWNLKSLDATLDGLELRTRARQARERAVIARKARQRIPDGWVEATEPVTRSFPVGRGASLTVVNASGQIQVTAGAADRIELNATKRAWGPNDEQAKQRLADATVEAFASGNRVELRVEQQSRGGRGVDVELDVKVPPDTAVDIRTASGNIKVVNVKGELRVQGVSGDIALEGTSRLAAVKTVSGNVTIADGAADAMLSLSSVSGNLTVQSLAARTVDANVISGNLILNGWTGDRAQLRTLSGRLEINATIAKGSRIEAESHSGDVQLSLPEQPGFNIEAHTFSGRIRIDFPVRTEGPVRDDRGPRSVRGVYGDGSASVRVQTFSGDVVLTRR